MSPNPGARSEISALARQQKLSGKLTGMSFKQAHAQDIISWSVTLHVQQGPSIAWLPGQTITESFRSEGKSATRKDVAQLIRALFIGKTASTGIRPFSQQQAWLSAHACTQQDLPVVLAYYARFYRFSEYALKYPDVQYHPRNHTKWDFQAGEAICVAFCVYRLCLISQHPFTAWVDICLHQV